MEKAYSVLGVHDSASAQEIEEAYRIKKRLYDLSRFAEGSLDWKFARARNEALDEAYGYVKSAAYGADFTPGGKYRDWDAPAPGSYSLGEIAMLGIICPAVVYAMQVGAPTILYELTPKGVRGAVWLLDVMALFAGYLSPLLARFALFRRPLAGLSAKLFLFPLTLLSADLCTSLLTRFYSFSGSEAAYVPFFYLVGVGPLFILLHAHCSILGMGARRAAKGAHPFRRVTAHTLTLLASAALSVVLCAELNKSASPAPEADPSARAAGSEQAWQILSLTDAGVMEVPGDWNVEEGGGKLDRTRHSGSVQYVRDALTAHTYGRMDSGLDFTLKLMAYWWTDLNGRPSPPPEEITDRLQEHQYDFIEREYPEIAFHARDVMELGGRAFDVTVIETMVIPGFAVRFRNVVFEHGNKVYTLTLSYPAYEENAWSETLEQVLSRWRLQ